MCEPVKVLETGHGPPLLRPLRLCSVVLSLGTAHPLARAESSKPPPRLAVMGDVSKTQGGPEAAAGVNSRARLLPLPKTSATFLAATHEVASKFAHQFIASTDVATWGLEP